MTLPVAAHYGGGGGDLAGAIAERLRSVGKDPETLNPADLAAVDEFHIRGRRATLELAARMRLGKDARVLDLGSGLGGPARTLAEAFGCHVTGVDLSADFCEAAAVLSDWVRLGGRVAFHRGDATDLPFEDNRFDAAMTLHVAMNIARKDALYGQARRVLKPGGIFAVYDVLQGEGGAVLYPVPWARDASISHLATPAEMHALLAGAGFKVLEADDSTAESQAWFEAVLSRQATSGPPPVTLQAVLGDDFPEMMRNQRRNLTERRIRTVRYICEA